jgi:hypothetical protein
VAGTTISSSVANSVNSDFATGLSTAVLKDGTQTTTASVPFAEGLSSAKLVDISASTAGQIKFPATQNASANANTLDDYEEGTFTGAFVCGTSGTITLDNVLREGNYVKVGAKVWLCGEFQALSVSAPMGALTLTGLPFSIPNAAQNYSAASIRASGLAATATTAIQGYGIINSTTMRVEKFAAGAAADLAGDVQAGSDFIISLTYTIV